MVDPVKRGGKPVELKDAVPAHLVRGLRGAQVADEEPDDYDSHSETVEQARERLQAAAASRSRRWHERLPVDYEDASLGDYDADTASRMQAFLADERARMLVLAGPVGVGKTRGLYAVGRLAVAQGMWTEAWSVHDLMKEMMPSAPAPALMESRATKCDLLLLDDLGASKATEFAVDTLTAILEARSPRRLKTGVSTNATEAQLAAVWGDRLVDRLRQGLIAVTLTGPSKRKPAW